MSEFICVLAYFFMGLVAGYVFFKGLWITVNSIASRKRPHIFIVLSYFLRLVFVGFFIYLSASDGFWWGPLVLLAGILTVRQVMIKKLRFS